jgi:hypothetical protein
MPDPYRLFRFGAMQAPKAAPADGMFREVIGLGINAPSLPATKRAVWAKEI